MSKPKHTPGPWIISESNIMGPIPFKADCIEFVLRDGYQPIFGMDPKILIGYLPWIQFPEKRLQEMFNANQRLIVASPDLLWSLRECSGYLESSFRDIASVICEAKQKDLLLNGLAKLMIEVNRAIAKAEGESSE